MEKEPEDYAGVLKGIRSLHEQKLLYDYTIEVENQEFKVHKIVMASVSDYFKAMFTGGMVESKTDRVRLEGLNAQAVSDMISFIYTGEFDENEASLADLIECAVYLQISEGIEECIHEVDPRRESEDINFQLLSRFQAYSLDKGIKKVFEYMINDFDEAFERWTPEEMTHNDVKNLIDIWQNSVWDLYLAIKQWVEVDSENRKQHVSSLMSHLQFRLLTPEQLEAMKESDLYTRSDGLWHEEVDKAVEYHSLAIHEKVLDDSKQSVIKNKAFPFYFNSDGHVLYELSQGTSWEKCEASEKPEMKHGIETFVVVNNFLIVCETFSTDQKWHVLDPRIMRWSPMAQLGTPRRDSALVSCNKHLYVLGGCPQGASQSAVPTDVIERYDFGSNSWSIIPSKLPIAVSKHGAAVIDNCIYVAGGLESGGEDSLRLDCYDTSTNSWHSKHSLVEADSHRRLQVMECDNEKVLFIMREGLYILFYRPSRDLWFERDCAKDVHRYSDKLRWHADASALSNQNELFLLNVRNANKGDDGRDDDQGSVGVCANWIIGPDNKVMGQGILEPLPFNHAGVEDYHKAFTILMLLAVPPQASAPLNMS